MASEICMMCSPFLGTTGFNPDCTWHGTKAQERNTRLAPVDATPLASNPVDDKIAPDINGKAPAATDTGLVTVAKQWKVTAKNWSGLKPDISEPFDERELVTRSQAEELLAAEREKVLFLKTAMEIAQTHCGLKDKTIDSLEADNAALIHDLNRIKDHETELVNDNEVKDREIERLTKSLIIEEQLNAAKAARIKELERCHEGTIDLCNQKTAQIEALEAKLTAYEKSGVRHD
ncbi:hypothetical protein R5W60_04360 [Brucella pseudintermedia]|uniref:hypothetical protein n=1 Tax=Brucella pseudintermedia TaxID=370111 RepID=UPI0036705B66|nr:hypothetical protein R5W60_04360 [Brucella pseudintermedia]